MNHRRLQGSDWYNYRKNHKLTLVCISKSKANNYRVDVLDESNHHKYHWLHPIEVNKLLESNWYKNNTIYNVDDFYNGKTPLKELIKQAKGKA